MSENADNVMPEGWRRNTWYVGDKVAWYVQSLDGKGSSTGWSHTHAEALCEAAEAARYVRDVQESRNKPPAPPAWMVEVAREANAVGYDANEMRVIAATCRTGDLDETPEHRTAVRALRLALERGHVVERREWTEDALLKAAREDAAQAAEGRGNSGYDLRRGNLDRHPVVQAALQARRNMLREGAVAVQAKAPDVDWEAALTKAFNAGHDRADAKIKGIAREAFASGFDTDRARAVSDILSTLPTREA